MALATAQTLSNNLLALSPSSNLFTAIPIFVGVIANFMNEVQAGPTGTVGIFTFGNAAMIAAMEAMTPVSDNSWIPIFANAWEAGVVSGVITPSTVTNSIWIGSGNKDTETSPSPSSTITTLSAAKAVLIAGLETAQPDITEPITFATAIRNATLAFEFTCIGLGSPPLFTPIPIVIAAE
jgi:hypothetical protein